MLASFNIIIIQNGNLSFCLLGYEHKQGATLKKVLSLVVYLVVFVV